MAVLPWRGTKRLGYVEYLVHGDGYTTSVLIVLEILGHRLRDLGSDPARFDIAITVRDAAGAVLRRAARTYPGRAPFALLSSADLLPPDRPVTGSVEFLLHCTDAAGRSLDETLIAHDVSPDAFLLWTDHRRSCTCTHTNMATGRTSALRAALRGLQWRVGSLLGRNHTYAGAVAVFEDDEFTSAIVLQSYERSWRRIPLELRNAAGDAVRTTIRGLGPHQVREVRLAEAFPGAREFLAGGPGNILVKSYPDDLRRYRFLAKTIHRATGAFSLDHSFYMSKVARQTYPAADHARLGKGFMFPHSVLINQRVRTSVILYNNELEDRAKAVGLLLYDREGRKVAHEPRAVTLPPRGFVHLDFADYLHLAPGDAFDGHFEIYHAEPSTADGRYATGLHGQVLYHSPAARESTQVDAAVPWHSPKGFERPSWMLRYQTVFMVVPFFCTDTLDTSIHCANVSHAWDYAECATFVCELVDGDGQVLDRQTIEVAPNAHVHRSLSDLFTRRPAGGVGVVFVRALDPDLSWVPLHYFIECRSAGVVTSDHGQGLYAYHLIGK